MADIFKEYFAAQTELEKEYNNDSIVLMMVGDFYEIYGIDLPDYKIGKAEEAHNILNMSMSRKNKSIPHSKTNPYMVGFPCYAIEEHIGKFLRANYTVGIWDQYDIPGKKIKGRHRTAVYTPSTFINDASYNPNNLMICYINDYKTAKGKTFKKFHTVIISLNTGKVVMQEFYDTENEFGRAENELYRLIHSYNPSEIIYAGQENTDFGKFFDITGKKIYFKEIPQTFYKSSYQNEFLKKIYPVENINVSPIEWLNLEKWSSLIPFFILGLSFAYQQNKLIVTKIQKPVIVDNKNQLILTGDSIYQLNLVRSSFDTTSLFDIICKARTPMGRRCFESRLLNPLKNPNEIEERYKLIEKLRPIWKNYEDLLRSIGDIEKKFRKMVNQTLHPFEFADLRTSYENCSKLLHLAKDVFNISPEIIQNLNQFIKEYSETFDFDAIKTSKLNDIKKNFFLKGVNSNLDNMQDDILLSCELLQDLANTMSEYIDSKDPAVKVDSTEKEGYYLTTTLKRFKSLPTDLTIDFEYHGKAQTISYSKLDIVKLTNSVKIRSPEIKKISSDIFSKKDKMVQEICIAYQSILQKWVDKWGDDLQKVADTIAHIDFIYSGAKTSVEWGYNKPTISNKYNGSSWFSATEIRHPIIERINDKEPFTTNDFSLGETHSGTIIYGLNMSGKSTLLRAIGCNIVLAQMGLFVPCEKFEFYPFTTMLSKMTIRDNMTKGQSTFMVEMLEVKNMLLRSGVGTLVLSDELCSSTESTSAHAIVAQTLHQLAESGSKFIFSTHLHELQKMDIIRKDPRMRICHFKVHFSGENIIFNRKLTEGGLSELYGLEVARTLGLPSEFMKGAFSIRDQLTGQPKEILSVKTSRYNTNVFIHACEQCGSTENLHTHHITPQKNADENGLIEGRYHKNSKFNLRVLCENCHQLHHKLN